MSDHSAPIEQASHRTTLVMVAVDDSVQSTWAAQVAADLAGPLRAGVVLVHVMDLRRVGASELAIEFDGLRGVLRRKAEEVLEKARSQFPPSVATQRLLREGDPCEEIVASAAEWEADLVVMGAHGRGRVATFLMGSTAEAVIRGAQCPVMTVSHDPCGRSRSKDGPVRLASMAI
jgi:nucleotide-binding universal stress UspA family protein